MFSKKNLYFILAIIFIYSCSINNPIEHENIKQNKIIVGEWTDFNKYTIEFFDNGSFRDTIRINRFNGNYKVVRLGKYYLNDSILKLTEFEFEDVEVKGKIDGFAYYSSNYKLQISEDKLKRQSIEIFKNIGGNGDELWGEWLSEGWICSYSDNSKEGEKIRFGIYNRYFTFNRDSTEYKLRYESDLHEGPLIDHSHFILFYPNLEIRLYGYTLKYLIEVSNGIMIWNPIDSILFNTNELIRKK